MVCVVALSIVTVLSIPRYWGGEADAGHVWWYAWVTCISTGLGVVPFVFVRRLSKFWLGVSNACASGFMMSASLSLFYEGFTLPSDGSAFGSSPVRVLLGLAVGVAFILGTRGFLEQHEDVKFDCISGLDARKALLVMGVMTIHSFSEGVAIGVSFAKEAPKALGLLISATLAVHNVPEGLAIALVLVPRGLSVLHAGLFCVFSSLPQPLMAVPAYLFVEHFVVVLPVGLGFAGGAMVYISLFELMPETLENVSKVTSGIAFGLSMCGGSLRLKGDGGAMLKVPTTKHKKEKKDKHKKKEKKSKKRKRERDGGSSEALQPPAEEELKIVLGTGRFLSSGTTVQGRDTRFQAELAVGDALLVRHPTTLQEETRIVTMVLSQISISISSPFSTDLISAVPFHFVKAPPKLAADSIDAEQAKRQKRSEAEKQAFGTYAGGGAVGETITYRRRKASAYGGYEIVTVQNTQGSLSREELLDMRCKHKADRNAQ
eukprot:g6639.t1